MMSGRNPGGAAPTGPTATGGAGDEAMGGAGSAAAGFEVVPAALLRSFTIHAEAFERWVADKGEELECDLPDRSHERPGAALSNLYYEALEAAVIDADPRIELNVNGDDDWESSGYYVVLHNRNGAQRRIGVTSGWNELSWLEAGTSPRDAAREYLEEICLVANEILAMVTESGSGRCAQGSPPPATVLG